MKICLFAMPELTLGKHNVRDKRLDEVDKISQSKKKTYLQVELVGEEAVLDADSILTLVETRQDLILKDLEFMETRLGRVENESEKALLNKLKNILEREEFICGVELSEEERKMISGYGLLTNKPIAVARKEELQESDVLLGRVLGESGFISFFTTGEKETRAWLIKNGITAWEAAGAVHSDIQKGFIRAEIISLNDFIQAGGEAKAKQAGKLRLEQKDYIMQDADLVNFRFNR